MATVLVTGATGFVGRTLCGTLARAGHVVHAALRRQQASPAGAVRSHVVGDIGAGTEWRDALDSTVDAVIHLAARTHMLHDTAANAAAYSEINERGTARLADAAAAAGVRRFIYVSSVKVNGEQTTDRPFTASDIPRPLDAYGRSKQHGEMRLLEIAARSAMQAVIVRPPLVYGPGVQANFLRMMRWVDRGWPLPLGAVRNARSLVGVDNLCDLLRHAVTSEAAPGRVWMVSDCEDVSTPDLLLRIGAAMHRPVRLLPVPVAMLRAAATVVGRRQEIARLCGSLTVDVEPTRAQLQWHPPVTLQSGLARTVEAYLRGERERAP
ncbi:MAG TPA: NAD-dependent epimerase/dehydratase family protein [Steroidobacteraceae bacterium]|nr:NAD-dependent epimerase/dehydratase family protein [Steroidobacteraceae bacterium]